MTKILLGILVGGILGAVLGLFPGLVLFDLIPKDPRTPLVTSPDYYFVRNKEFIVCIGCLLGLFGGGLLGAIAVATSLLLEASNRWYWVIARRPMGLALNGRAMTSPQHLHETDEHESHGRPDPLLADAGGLRS
jgi:hypothetical protein